MLGKGRRNHLQYIWCLALNFRLTQHAHMSQASDLAEQNRRKKLGSTTLQVRRAWFREGNEAFGEPVVASPSSRPCPLSNRGYDRGVSILQLKKFSSRSTLRFLTCKAPDKEAPKKLCSAWLSLLYIMVGERAHHDGAFAGN